MEIFRFDEGRRGRSKGQFVCLSVLHAPGGDLAANSVRVGSAWLVEGEEMTEDEGEFSWPWKVVHVDRIRAGIRGSLERVFSLLVPLDGGKVHDRLPTVGNPPSPHDRDPEDSLGSNFLTVPSRSSSGVSGCIVARVEA